MLAINPVSCNLQVYHVSDTLQAMLLMIPAANSVPCIYSLRVKHYLFHSHLRSEKEYLDKIISFRSLAYSIFCELI